MSPRARALCPFALAGEREVYPPEGWANDLGRRERSHVPDEVSFRSKPQIALCLVDLSREWGVPFEVVVADSGYGSIPASSGALSRASLLRVRGGEHLRGAPARGEGCF